MKILFYAASIILLLNNLSFASDLPSSISADLCICQTGDAPANQIKYFKMGCKAWLAAHDCAAKETTDIKTRMGSTLLNYKNAKRIKLGYVGHWASASETVTFLKSKVTSDIAPLNLQYVDIDNTACLSNDNPYEILKYFKKIGYETASKINVRGNQVNSSGMWDSVLPGKTNFWAVTNGNNMQAIFPDCAEFKGKKCYANFQKDDIGVCYNSSSKKYERLICAKKLINYSWQPKTSLNLIVTKHENKTLNKVTLGFKGITTANMTVLYLSDENIVFNTLSARSLLFPQIPVPRLAQLTELANIYGLPLTPILKAHEKTFMPELYAVSESGSEYLNQVFETEVEANIFVANAERDPRFLLWEASQRD